MKEEEAKAVIEEVMGPVRYPPWQHRLWAWMIEVIHPLGVHHWVRSLSIREDMLVRDNGICCRICGRAKE